MHVTKLFEPKSGSDLVDILRILYFTTFEVEKSQIP